MKDRIIPMYFTLKELKILYEQMLAKIGQTLDYTSDPADDLIIELLQNKINHEEG